LALHAARARDLAFAGAAVGPLADPGEDADDLILLRDAYRLVTGQNMPRLPSESLTRARGWLRLGDEEKARAELDAAVAAAAGDPLVWAARAGVWREHGRPDAAAAELARGRAVAAADLAARPSDPLAGMRLAL